MMTLEQLKSRALTYVTILPTYELVVEDQKDDKATFIWQNPQDELDSCVVELDEQGNLLALAQPFKVEDSKSLEVNELQQIAEDFLSMQYPEALQFLTLFKIVEDKDRTFFKYKQLVEGYPLDSSFCMMEMGNTGRLIDFNYHGYMMNPPLFPSQLAKKEPLLQQLSQSDWQLKVDYLSTDYYSVATSAVHMFYESTDLNKSFDAVTGKDLYENFDDEDEDEMEVERYIPLPDVKGIEKKDSMEDIIGVPTTMKIVRQYEISDGVEAIVWQDEARKANENQSMEQFIKDRVEDCVKAKWNTKNNRLEGFMWFKERDGDLHLTNEQCVEIAVSFLKTYFSEYIPYLQMKTPIESVEAKERVFLTFPLVVEGYVLDGYFFDVLVNRETGFIDNIMPANIEIEKLESFEAEAILEIDRAKQALKDVDLEVEWIRDRDDHTQQEKLIYKYKHDDTKQRIKGIDAVTGELITTIF